MRRLFFSSVLLLTSLTLATRIAAADPVLYPDGSVRYAAESPNIPVVAIETGDLCDIVLQPGEHLNQAIISDSLRWKMTDGTSGNDTPHVFLKPTRPGLRALLTVTTSRRTYHLRVVSHDGPGREFIGWYYPATIGTLHPHSASVAQATGPQPTTTTPWTCASPLDARYRVDGATQFRPLFVCNDGTRTYVNLGAIRGTLPVLVTVGEGREDQIIGNATWDPSHNEYVVDGVPDRLALLRDSRKGQIRVNIQRTTK